MLNEKNPLTLNAIKNDYHLRKVIGQRHENDEVDLDEWAKTTAEKMLVIVKAQLKGEPLPPRNEDEISVEEATASHPEV